MIDEEWEDGEDGLESANRLNVLFGFGGNIYYTNSFKETMLGIFETKEYEKDFMGLWNFLEDMADDLLRLASCATTIHLARLSIKATEEDIEKGVIMLRTMLKIGNEKHAAFFLHNRKNVT